MGLCAPAVVAAEPALCEVDVEIHVVGAVDDIAVVHLMLVDAGIKVSWGDIECADVQWLCAGDLYPESSGVGQGCPAYICLVA